MSRFDQEFALVPEGARWTAALVCLAVTALMGAIFLVPGLAERNGTALLVMSPFFLLSLIGVAFLGAFVLLVGYVYGEARDEPRAVDAARRLHPERDRDHPVLHPARPDPRPLPLLRRPGEKGPRLLRRLRRRGTDRLSSVPAADRDRLAELRAVRRSARSRRYSNVRVDTWPSRTSTGRGAEMG
jgi:hypothetical protein